MSRACDFDLSPCCGAQIIVAGERSTHWYACGQCGQSIPSHFWAGKPKEPQDCRHPNCSCGRPDDCEPPTALS